MHNGARARDDVPFAEPNAKTSPYAGTYLVAGDIAQPVNAKTVAATKSGDKGFIVSEPSSR